MVMKEDRSCCDDWCFVWLVIEAACKLFQLRHHSRVQIFRSSQYRKCFHKFLLHNGKRSDFIFPEEGSCIITASESLESRQYIAKVRSKMLARLVTSMYHLLFWLLCPTSKHTFTAKLETCVSRITRMSVSSLRIQAVSDICFKCHMSLVPASW